jgi:hypothetical protein
MENETSINHKNGFFAKPVLVAGLFANQIKMTDEIKRMKKELKEWKSQEVKERFERVNSQLHIVTINELEHKIKRLKRGEDI